MAASADSSARASCASFPAFAPFMSSSHHRSSHLLQLGDLILALAQDRYQAEPTEMGRKASASRKLPVTSASSFGRCVCRNPRHPRKPSIHHHRAWPGPSWAPGWCIDPPGLARRAYTPCQGPGWPWPGTVVVYRWLPRSMVRRVGQISSHARGGEGRQKRAEGRAPEQEEMQQVH